jgi:quinol monooxygenase YgiN
MDARDGPIQSGRFLNMIIVRIAELEIDPNQIAAYNTRLSEEVEASVRTEPGVLLLYALSIKGSPDKVRVIEAYADQAAYEAHLTTPHFLKYKRRTAGMVKSARLLETEPIALKAKGQISN